MLFKLALANINVNAFINVKGKINFVPEIDIAFDQLWQIEKIFVTN